MSFFSEVVFPVGAIIGAIFLVDYLREDAVRNALHEREAIERGYAAFSKFPQIYSEDLNPIKMDDSGRPKLVYNGTNYFLKVGTNGVPYFEPMRGLEGKAEK